MRQSAKYAAIAYLRFYLTCLLSGTCKWAMQFLEMKALEIKMTVLQKVASHNARD